MEINRNNYESFFLLYLDRELNPSEMSEVEKFVNDNADLQKEFSLLHQTVLIPAQIEFDQKELLFRKEEKRRVIPVYWTRIAAAVAVLVFSGWLMTTQLLRKQGDGIAGSESKKNIITAKKNGSDQKIKEANTNTAGLPDASANKIQPIVQQNVVVTKNQPAVQQNITAIKNQPAVQQNITVIKNQPAVQQSITAIKNQPTGNYGTAKKRTKPENDLSGKNNQVQPLASANPDLQNPTGENPEGSNPAMQKSSAQELQPVDSRYGKDPKQISAQPGIHSPVLLIAATDENVPHVRDENTAFVENEDQTDNAISVVALNDKNKGITRLFKKLTRRAPTVDNERKVRVSVFQFSY